MPFRGSIIPNSTLTEGNVVEASVEVAVDVAVKVFVVRSVVVAGMLVVVVATVPVELYVVASFDNDAAVIGAGTFVVSVLTGSVLVTEDVGAVVVVVGVVVLFDPLPLLDVVVTEMISTGWFSTV
jgi:uncharacterized membrane protein